MKETVPSEALLINTIKLNLESAKRNLKTCAGNIRTVVEGAVKLFYLKTTGSIPVWAYGSGYKNFSLKKAIKDPRFEKRFDTFILSDLEETYKICSDALHAGTPLAERTAKKAIDRVTEFLLDMQKVIGVVIISGGVIISDDIEKTPRPLPHPPQPSECYEEPDFEYVILKTSEKRLLELDGSLYAATKYAWRANISKISGYKYVFSVIDKIVRGVFIADEWHVVKQGVDAGRCEFTGRNAPPEISDRFIGKRVPSYYTGPGMSSPVLYKKHIK